MVVPPGEPGEASGDGPEEGESGGPSGGDGRRGGSESGRAEAGAAGDKPETRSVCSSESGSGSHPGGAGPICKICFQGPEQVRRREEKRAGRASGSPPPRPAALSAGRTDRPIPSDPSAPSPAPGGGRRRGAGRAGRREPVSTGDRAREPPARRRSGGSGLPAAGGGGGEGARASLGCPARWL